MSEDQLFDTFVRNATEAGVRLQVEPHAAYSTHRPDALFHIPLLALAILVIAQSRRDGVATTEIGTWVALAIQRTFGALRISPQRLRYSVTLRRRCTDALLFLEGAGLARVTGADRRMIRPSKEGGLFLKAALTSAGDIGVLARGLMRCYSAARQQGVML